MGIWRGRLKGGRGQNCPPHIAAAFLVLICSLATAAGADPLAVEAAKHGNREALHSLITQHADINAPGSDGMTALHWAAQAGDAETVQLLLRAGANVKAASRYGITPLSLAATNGDASMIEALLKAGADPNAALPEGETILMTASRTGNPDAVRLLVAKGADPNAKEKSLGETALMWAAAENHADAVRALVQGGGGPKRSFQRFDACALQVGHKRHGVDGAPARRLDGFDVCGPAKRGWRGSGFGRIGS